MTELEFDEQELDDRKLDDRELDDRELDDRELDDRELDDRELDDRELDDRELDDLELEDEDLEDDGLEPEVVWNGGEMPTVEPAPGCTVSFYLDNKLHHAVCLAVIGDELLLEHKGASRCFLFTGKVVKIVPRLRVGIVSATITVGALKACHYRSVGKKWLQQMIRTGQAWKGIEGGGKIAPSPTDLLKGQMELF